MAIVYILLAVVTVANLIWLAANIAEGDSLDEMENDLHKYSVYLDERANRLAADEETIRMLNKELKKELERYGKEEEH